MGQLSLRRQQAAVEAFIKLTTAPQQLHLNDTLHSPASNMVQDIPYNSISLVIENWEALRRLENYEEVAGATLFQYLFQHCPQAKVLFGFPIDVDASSPEVNKSKRFLMHASYMIQMLDTALNMLGPDIELLSEIMAELGQKHVRYGVKPEYFPVMGDALDHTLTIHLPKIYDDSAKEAWKVTYGALSQDMIKAYATKTKRSSSKA